MFNRFKRRVLGADASLPANEKSEKKYVEETKELELAGGSQPSAEASKLVPREFLPLTEGQAFLICELVGGEYLTGDSRLTLAQRLSDAVDDDWSDKGGFILDVWSTNSEDLGTAELAARIRQLNGKQAQSIISAAKRFWKMADNDEFDSEPDGLARVGLR